MTNLFGSLIVSQGGRYKLIRGDYHGKHGHSHQVQLRDVQRHGTVCVYTSPERRDEACAACNCGDMQPIPAIRARRLMRETLLHELWATPDDFRLGGRLVHQDAITEYYMQMIAQIG